MCRDEYVVFGECVLVSMSVCMCKCGRLGMRLGVLASLHSHALARKCWGKWMCERIHESHECGVGVAENMTVCACVREGMYVWSGI